MSFDNTVYDARNRIVGFRCWQCDEVKSRMWGTICNQCRFANELARSLRMIAEGITAEDVHETRQNGSGLGD